MTYDSPTLNLTREEALKLHRQMWTEMQEKLGDNPSAKDRDNFKADWCVEHFPEYRIRNHCFLCDLAGYLEVSDGYCRNKCPIDWSSLRKHEYDNADCCAVYKGVSDLDEMGDNEVEIYCVAPISEILALPEREVSDV